jgi:DNA-binding MarR family transcriptional regulator/N-acetylglutamate synthase-like GNAT family acetyltransferase
MDMIQKLGPLAFASRLKRISERLMRDVSHIYRELDVEFQARWFPVMYLLGQKSPLAVTEVARELGMSHPAINQIAAGMSKAGLLVSTRDSHDDRKRMLSISAAGGRVMTSLVPVWRDIEAATQEVIKEGGSNLLEILNRVELALDEKDMYERVKARIRRRQYEAVEIIDYLPQYKSQFKALNIEWLRKYFTVEKNDRTLLSDPQKEILQKGGFINFARIEGKVVGTAALLKHGDGIFELAKMAVTESAQGGQAGRKLAETMIAKARSLGARSIILHTSPKLTRANSLYKRLGFVYREDAPQPPGYARPTITMILETKK